MKFDGKDYPNVGPNVAAGSASSVRRVNQNTLEMTDKTNGKIADTRADQAFFRSQDLDGNRTHSRPK